MTDPRLDIVLERAHSRVQRAVSDALDKLAAQLGPLALSATSNALRQSLMDAQRALQLHTVGVVGGFGRRFQQQIDKAVRQARSGPTTVGGSLQPLSLDTDWSTLSLVDNAEVERGVTADRLGQALAHECDGHLQALQAYVTTLLDDASPERNPLRPHDIARAMLEAIAEAGCQNDVVETLAHHLGRVMGPELDACYEDIVQDMRGQGIVPRSLSVNRGRAAGSVHGGMAGATGPDSLDGALPRSATQAAGFGDSRGGPRLGSQGANAASHQAGTHLRAAQALSEMFGMSMPMSLPMPMGTDAGALPIGLRAGAPRPGAPLPAVNADFQNLLRQIAAQSVAQSVAQSAMHLGGPAASAWDAETGLPLGVAGTGPSQAGGPPPSASVEGGGFAGPLMAVNLIRAHREELVRASGGAALDQMVIDIVAALFDQVLSDPKVAPEMARQIARLQMPVLRVALGDMSFFNSRKHPVRRFVNRIASLSASFESYEDDPGRACLARVTELVDEIVEGDFDRMDVYESKLAELESFIDTENAREAAENAAVASLLNGKEADLRVHQRYMQILKRELADVEMPDFLRDFLSQIWSQVQVTASARDGVQSPIALRMKKAGHDLALSVQPKGTPQLRKAFLLKLPQLMKELNEGLALIQWPEEAKQAFFAQLLPAHAECLKAAPQHDLTQRMLEHQLTKVERIAIPSREEAANDPLPEALTDPKAPPVLTVVPTFSATEAQEAGFLAEAAVVAEGPLDIDLDQPGGSDPTLGDIDINLDAPPPPSAGLQLVHHIQKGTAYQMLMQGQWKKVRLTWVSDGRTFFIFTHGHTHKQTISLTARTLAKMCDSGRFKAFEQAELIERATVRARRQLAALNSGVKTRSAA